ncbi:MAG: hypothetical protein K8T89_26075 [Planctomycetes bacterium]|nr:hypothetical protein [Planctomycetota bacterium]
MEDELVGYLIGALDPETHRQVSAWLSENPERGIKLERLRRVLEPLAVDQETIEPPADLAVRTISFVAEHLVSEQGAVVSSGTSQVSEFIRSLSRPVPSLNVGGSPIFPRTGSEVGGPAPRRRNFAVMGGLSTAVVLIAIAGIVTVRQTQEVKACQNKMRTVHQALTNYSDLNGHQFPQVMPDEDVQMTMSKFQRSGMMPDHAHLICPGTGHVKAAVPVLDYAYSLGYRDENGTLRGVMHNGENEQFPILADAPERQVGGAAPINHRKGQNVLFAGGHVRFCANPMVGPTVNGETDDIYYNTAREPHAGTHRWDSVLGCANEHP